MVAPPKKGLETQRLLHPHLLHGAMQAAQGRARAQLAKGLVHKPNLQQQQRRRRRRRQQRGKEPSRRTLRIGKCHLALPDKMLGLQAASAAGT
jgi:hypothetical protein